MYGILSGFVDGSLIPEKGEAIRFDRECDSWSVFSFEACRQILQRDFELARADLYSSSARAVRGNNRSLAVLSGRDHLALHGYLTRRVGVRSSRPDTGKLCIGPIVQAALDSLDPSSPVDVAASIADQIPIRVGLAMIGVDISDAGRVDEIAELKTRFTRWSDRDDDDPVLTQLAADAFHLAQNDVELCRWCTIERSILGKICAASSGAAVRRYSAIGASSRHVRGGATHSWAAVRLHTPCARACTCCCRFARPRELGSTPATRIPRFVSEVLWLLGRSSG